MAIIEAAAKAAQERVRTAEAAEAVHPALSLGERRAALDSLRARLTKLQQQREQALKARSSRTARSVAASCRKISGKLESGKSRVNSVHVIDCRLPTADCRLPHVILLEGLTYQAYRTMHRSH